MNYYPHHIGDFNNATRHLTRVERALYRELIELYYDIEAPLPAIDLWICKKVLASGQVERDAVKALLAEFFTLTPDGEFYRHSRCDREIASYRAKQEAAVRAGKASAESRLNAKATERQRNGNGRSTVVQPTNNQEPRTSNQEPRTTPLPPSVASLPEWLDSKTWNDYVKTRPSRARKPESLQAAISKLSKFRDEGFDPNEIVANSLANGWQMLKPPDPRRSTVPDYSSLQNKLQDGV